MKKLLIGTGLIGAVILGSISSQSNPTQTKQSVQINQTSDVIEVTSTPNSISSEAIPLSNDNYYINSAGNKVHSPAYAPIQPSGSTARCRDGTYSFSQSRRGTCSRHGGVAEWF